MKLKPLGRIFVGLLLILTGAMALFPYELNLDSIAELQGYSIKGEDGVAFAVFMALCFSIGLTTLVTRWKKCPLPGALVGIICFVLCIGLWPSRVDVEINDTSPHNYKTSIYVYRPIWKQPLPQTQREDWRYPEGELAEYQQTGSGRFSSTIIKTYVRDGQLDRIPERPREGWSEADIAEIRGRSTSYMCLNRRESMFGVIFKLELFTPLFSAEGVRAACTPVE